MKYNRKIDRENVKIFKKYGTENSGVLRHRCVICGKEVSIDGSISCRGYRLICTSCARTSKFAYEWVEKGDIVQHIRHILGVLRWKIKDYLAWLKWFISTEKCSGCKYYIKHTFTDDNGEWEAHACVKRVIRICCKGEGYYESNDRERTNNPTPRD